MNKTLFVTLVSTSALALSLTLADSWDGYNDPERMSQGRYVYDFNQLPAAAEITNSRIPWPETYWPTHKGGVAYRWQNKKPSSSWSYRLHSLSDLLKLQATRPEEIAKLSPAEKFDIWQGDYTYPTVKKERGRTSPSAPSWTGICHGWAPAAILHDEPTAKTVKNADGIEIPFASSDIKAILIYYYGKVKWQPIGWTGKRCSGGLFRSRSGCRGVNPATLHIVMANQIGLLDEAFIMDRDRNSEIWNQPFYAYSTERLGSCGTSSGGRSNGATHGVKIRMTTKWVTELRKSQWEPFVAIDPETGKLASKTKTLKYTYCLEMTPSGRIVGGQWMGSDRPGFIWNHRMADFSANPYYGRIRELLNDDPSRITTPTSPQEIDENAPTVDEILAY